MAAVFGSKEGIRFPISPRPAVDDGAVGPAVPNAWVGTSGVAEGLLNLAILSLSEPDTARGLGSPGDPPVGGVRFVLDLISAELMYRERIYSHVDALSYGRTGECLKERKSG